MKRRLFFLLLLPLLVACQGNQDGSVSGSNGKDPSNTTTTAQSEGDAFAYEAATSFGLLSTLNIEASKTLYQKRAVSESLLSTITDYLPTIEAMLSGEDIVTNTILQGEGNPDYETNIEVSFVDINGTENAFLLSYDKFPLDKPERDEEEYRIEGVITAGELSYPIRGKIEREEDELEVSFRYSLSEDTYVHVEQEKERGESSYEYEVKERGRTIHAFSLEIEDREVELEILNGTNHDYAEMTFVRYEKDGKTYIRARLDREVLLFVKNADNTFTLVE